MTATTTDTRIAALVRRACDLESRYDDGRILTAEYRREMEEIASEMWHLTRQGRQMFCR